MDALPSRVFMNGNNKAVHIPAEFRLATDRVQISRTPQGDLLVHTCPPQRGKALIDLLAGFDADFLAALEQQQTDHLPDQEPSAYGGAKNRCPQGRGFPRDVAHHLGGTAQLWRSGRVDPGCPHADDDLLLVIASHLPGEAVEANIDLAHRNHPRKTGGEAPDQGNFYEHPNAQRRFRVLTGSDELARALDYPWERWIGFLHPSQADWVSRSFKGPTRVQGSADTGITVVALHRAVFLARRSPDARALLTTFSKLAWSYGDAKLDVFISHLGPLVDAVVAGVCVNNGFLSVEQLRHRGEVMDVG